MNEQEKKDKTRFGKIVALSRRAIRKTVALKKALIRKLTPTVARVRILAALQLSNKMKLTVEKRRRLIGDISVRIVLVAISSVVVSFFFYLINSLFAIDMTMRVMIFVLATTQIIGIIAATNGLMHDLYKSKENQILHAFPVRLDEVFASKLVVFYIQELLRNVYLIIPMLIGFGFVNQVSPGYYINILPVVVILPIIVVLVSTALSMPMVHIRNVLVKYHRLALFSGLLALGATYYLVMRLMWSFPVPFEFIRHADRYVSAVLDFMGSVSHHMVLYNNIGRLMFGQDVFVNYLIIFTSLILAGIFVILVSRPLYFRLSSRSSEHAVQKKRVTRNRQERNLYLTFLRKELTITFRNINQLLNDYTVLLTLPFFMFVLNYIYMALPRVTTGNHAVLAFNVLIISLIAMASNTASATAITSEGWEFILVKTSPLDTKRIAWAKITLNLVFSTLVLLLGFIIFRWTMPDFPFRPMVVWLLFALIFIINSAHILWSFQLDLLNPRLGDYAQTGTLSDNPNVGRSVGIGLIIATVFGALALIMFIFMSERAWWVLYLFATAFLAFRLYSFNIHLKAKFSRIEF